MFKMTLLHLANIIFEKVKKFQNSSIILREMASDLLGSGCINPTPPPPASFRVKTVKEFTERLCEFNQKHISCSNMTVKNDY